MARFLSSQMAFVCLTLFLEYLSITVWCLEPLGLETEEVTAGSVRLNSEVETGGAQSKQPSWALLRPSFFI